MLFAVRMIWRPARESEGSIHVLRLARLTISFHRSTIIRPGLLIRSMMVVARI